MRNFIENNIRTIINILIIVVFILPSVIAMYFVLLGATLSVNQAMALTTLFGIGSIALGISKISEI